MQEISKYGINNQESCEINWAKESRAPQSGFFQLKRVSSEVIMKVQSVIQMHDHQNRKFRDNLHYRNPPSSS